MGRGSETQLQMGKKTKLYFSVLCVKYFKPLEVVGRGSETQLQVVKNMLISQLFECSLF